MKLVRENYKKLVQTFIYLPHFMSWVVVVSISYVLLTMDGGIINGLLKSIGIQNKLTSYWIPIGSVQCISCKLFGVKLVGERLSSLQQLLQWIRNYMKLRRWMVRIVLDKCGILRYRPLKVSLSSFLILKIGDVLELGFEHVFLLLNSTNRHVAEIFDTYVYVAGLRQGQFSYATAVGLFKGFVGLVLSYFCQLVSEKEWRRRHLLIV